jgi:hypothetical protein
MPDVEVLFDGLAVLVCFRWHEGNAFDVEILDYH